MAARLATVAVALALGGAAAAQPRPDGPADNSDRLVWDLSPLFRSDAAWDDERNALLLEIPRFAAYRGTLGNSAAALRQALDASSLLDRRLQRLWVYASTQQSTDNRDPRNQERVGLMQTLGALAGSARAWLNPEIQSLGRPRIDSLVAAEPGLQVHAVNLRRILALARHTLSADTEAALAAYTPVIDASSQVRTLLVDADMDWPWISVDGRQEKLNATGYTRLRQHPDRALRKEAFELFFGRLGQFENSFGATLSTRVRSGTVAANLRQHPTAVAASLSAYEMPEAVYRTLVEQVNVGLPTLHRYFKLRQRMLGLPDLHYHDIYPPLVELKRSFPAAEAARLTLEATKPLGPEYQRLLSQALSMRSMHVQPADGKSSGAYQTGVYGLTPLVFLNHQDDFQSVSTFAHEWGHGMHTLLANAAQPFETARYPLFMAEIASMTNETLLAGHLQVQSSNREERLFQLGFELENLRGGFFRQAMFSEFELATHDATERGEALTGKRVTALYCGLLRKYHGADAGVMAINPLYCQEWALIPHFYRPFYVYQYATSIAAASYFGEQLLAARPGARDTYLGILRAGGSLPPYELLKSAGLDMATPAPYQALVKRMNRVIDEMERLLDEKA